MVEEKLFHFCDEHHVGNYYSALVVAALQAAEQAIHLAGPMQGQPQVGFVMGTCRGGLFVEVGLHDGITGAALPIHASDKGEAGDGMFIIQQLADKVSLLDNGAAVRMEFSIAGIDAATALERIALLREHMAMVAA